MRYSTAVTMIVLSAVVSLIARTDPFILGADMSWCQEREANGIRYADNGTVKDVFDIIKDHKFNYIRLRLFVDPTAKVAGEKESPYSIKGYCDLAHTREMAKRIKKAGMKFLLDFHYSDTWCDPAKQHKPVSWSGLPFDRLTQKVRSYTKECLEAFKADGTLPDMVQVGNEIVGGMIWPDGRSSNMSNFAKLVNAGIDGVKDVDTSVLIMIHSISENSPNTWLKNLINAGVKRIDVFGLSYYSKWHGTPDDLQKRVIDVVANHKVKVVIAEYADNHKRVNDILFQLPNEQGLGTFVWEPTEWMDALFDWKNGRRETNSRIDIYPQLYKDYGNDVVVVDRISNVNSLYHKNLVFHYTSDGMIVLHLDNPVQTVISLITLQGKLAGHWNVNSTGVHVLDMPGFLNTSSGRYIFKIEQNGRVTHVDKSLICK